ncbi:DUF262 domain-containing protein [Vermiculatibacterium agrestimuris]|uniref:DUF262 domain-containing protein n=1 Tax=Vermiculatibacterium agrestimuris TaxID=2941519 RepID=UPI00203B3D0B|nr:DUF262 domain-containing protein [Vermiculatibacterium agrestimuris]
MFKIFQETKPIKWIHNQKSTIDFSPAYQRHSSLWKKAQKQLLIDSILNGLDIPKFYFQFMPPAVENLHYNYAIIDGKQRIETILGFIDDEFPLSNEFTFLDDSLTQQFGDISGKYFSELESIVPALIARFWQYELNIVFMDTTTPDIINELFVRLNSGVPVSTSEKRNANGGILSNKIQELCDTSLFFTKKIKIANHRFAQNDLALKLLMLESGEWDLTKKSVDNFLNDNRDFRSCSTAFEELRRKVNSIAEVFVDRDNLLSKKNIIITLYTVLADIPIEKLRLFMQYFENYRVAVQTEDNTNDEHALLNEFTRLLQQGSDKKSSIQERSNIMKKYIQEFLKYN